MTVSIFNADQIDPGPLQADGDNTIEKQLHTEADVIVTCAVLGFICTRYYQGQSCQFDYEHPTEQLTEWFEALDSNNQEKIRSIISDEYSGDVTLDEKISYVFKKYFGAVGSEASKAYTRQLLGMQDLYRVLDALSVVVTKQEPDMGTWLQDGQSPFGKEGELITGKKGGEMLLAKQRATPYRISKALMLRNALEKKNMVYQGRGAYTGLVENPLKTDKSLYPTMRVQPTGTTRQWGGIDGKDNWGLISPEVDPDVNLDPKPERGMGPLPGDTGGDTQIGYIHGMCTAIEKSMEECTCCTPYEMATGEKTTKMASCFPCSTYMYSSGYPPTSIHLGSGESWLPPQSGTRLELLNVNGPLDGEVKQTNLINRLCGNLSARWHLEMHQQMKLGLVCLQRVEEYMDELHYAQLENLQERLARDAGENAEITAEEKYVALCNKGGSVFLDALTMHDKEINRLRRTFQPLYDILKGWDEEILVKNNV